jgi:site-specific recombinase XerD
MAEIFDRLTQLVEDSVRSPHSKRAYRRELRRFLSWWWVSNRSTPAFTKALVNQYINDLIAGGGSTSSVRIALTAIRRLADEAADNGLTGQEVPGALSRIKAPPRRGRRLGRWLSVEEASKLADMPDVKTGRGLRDRALLATLLFGGLRRAEAAALRFENIQLAEGRWAIVDLIGKHDRIRTVGIPDCCKERIDQWAEASGRHSGRVFVAVNKADTPWGEGLTPQAVRDIVSRYASLLQLPVAPHDLRRTHAKLAFKGGATVHQIQRSLGHASLATTERYLGTDFDIKDAPGDHVRLTLDEEKTSSEDPHESHPTT